MIRSMRRTIEWVKGLFKARTPLELADVITEVTPTENPFAACLKARMNQHEG